MSTAKQRPEAVLTKPIQVYFDGACFPKNPGGYMGMGAIIIIEGKREFELSETIDEAPENSNNVAEYMAFFKAIEWLWNNEQYLNSEIIVRGDSKLVIEQMSGNWRIKKGRYAQYANLCKEIIKSFTNIRFEWIPREMNEICDALSTNKVINSGIEFKIRPEHEYLTKNFKK